MTCFVGANWTLSSPPVTETRLHSTAASIGSSATTGWLEDILGPSPRAGTIFRSVLTPPLPGPTETLTSSKAPSTGDSQSLAKWMRAIQNSSARALKEFQTTLMEPCSGLEMTRYISSKDLSTGVMTQTAFLQWTVPIPSQYQSGAEYLKTSTQ